MGGKSEERKIAETQEASAQQRLRLQLQEQREALKKQLSQQRAQLRGAQIGQEQALKRAQDIYGQETGRFAELQRQQALAGFAQQPEEISQLQKLIRERALPEQQQALSRTKLAQVQAGVRGPEAALQSAMAASKMGSELARATQQVALQQALSDREKRQQEALRKQRSAEEFAQRQALAGLGQVLTPVQKFVGNPALEVMQQQSEAIRRRLLDQG